MGLPRKILRPVGKLQPSSAAVNLIADFEGFVGHAYKPVAAERYYTIGYGHYGPDVKAGQTITRSEARKLLRKDMAWAAQAVRQGVRVQLNQNEFDALVSFIFNVGSGNFASSMLLRQLNRRRYRLARLQLFRWVFGASGRLLGLVRRRRAESKLWQGRSKFIQRR